MVLLKEASFILVCVLWNDEHSSKNRSRLNQSSLFADGKCGFDSRGNASGAMVTKGVLAFIPRVDSHVIWKDRNVGEKVCS
tara:strand:+ start:605 stop:847 length:243 start_codon:yes stop_codon:yes gene_type:complete